MTYAACKAHAYPRRDCDDCRSLPDSRLLRELRAKYATPPLADQPIQLTEAVDEMGRVTHVRLISWVELLDLVERDCRGDVA